ncbi:TPA: tetratricopeptide repeat protein, partial [bacterium]|nr:tetratricopeptide repeat protein [bacterium]
VALADEYKDSKEKKSVCLFMTAVSYEEEKQYEDAIKIYDELAENYPELNVSVISKKYAQYCRESLAEKNK